MHLMTVGGRRDEIRQMKESGEKGERFRQVREVGTEQAIGGLEPESG